MKAFSIIAAICCVMVWSFIGGIHAERYRSGGVSVSQSTRKVNLARSVSVGSQKQSTNAGCSGNSSAVPMVLSLLWRAESSYGADLRRGDGGKARGPMQIHRGYWQDGCEQLGVDWPYSDSDRLDRSAAVMAGVWARYAKQALESGGVEGLVRAHRLPSAPYRSDNTEYVVRAMK